MRRLNEVKENLKVLQHDRMTFFKHFSHELVSHGVMEDKGQGQNADGSRGLVDNGFAYATSSEK